MEGAVRNESLKAVIMEEEKEQEKASYKASNQEATKEIAVSKEMSDVELLEEFVQSFLA